MLGELNYPDSELDCRKIRSLTKNPLERLWLITFRFKYTDGPDNSDKNIWRGLLTTTSTVKDNDDENMRCYYKVTKRSHTCK